MWLFVKDGIFVAEYGPLYNHLGVANNNREIAQMIADRMSIAQKEVRVVSISHCPFEAIDLNGCPVANHILTRGQEKVLVLTKPIPNFQVQIVIILLWNGIPLEMANYCFAQLRGILGRVLFYSIYVQI